MMYLTLYELAPADAKALKLKDTYSLHRAVYGLFEKKGSQCGRGILYVDKGYAREMRRVLILSDRMPGGEQPGRVAVKDIPDAFLEFPRYRFEIVLNPVRRSAESGRIVPVKGREAICGWFTSKSSSSGFSLCPETLQVLDISVDVFEKKGQRVTLEKARLTGVLEVNDRVLFKKTFCSGMGRGKAFGCGMLQITPVIF